MSHAPRKVFPIVLADEELTLVCGGFDSFGSSGLAVSIATLGLDDDSLAHMAHESVSAVSLGFAPEPTAWEDASSTGLVFGNEGFHLTENADGTFSAVGVYEPTATYDVSRWAEASAPSSFDLDDDSALALALQRLVA